MTSTISGQIIDIHQRRIYGGVVQIAPNGTIESIVEQPVTKTHYILPPFIDSHVHIESTMLTPAEFARAAVKFGVAGVVCDPHEIANVMGMEGIRYMIDNGRQTPFKFCYAAPSCVPVTAMETSGAVIDAAQIEELLDSDDVFCLAEVMDYPSVVHRNEEVMAKINAAKKRNKPVDGHAPGLYGQDLEAYVGAGISTDHECFSLREAEEKIRLGMHIQIREGSAAQNLDTLYPLIDKYPDRIMLCTDDCHPDDLLDGYIQSRIARCVAKGLDIFHILQAVSINPVRHYGLPVGMLRVGDPADFIIVENLKNFAVKQTYINGNLVFNKGKTLFEAPKPKLINRFYKNEISVENLRVPITGKRIKAIKIIDKELITRSTFGPATAFKNGVKVDVERDLLKIVVLNRYNEALPAVGFINNFGIKRGAVCITVAHDSHNIIAVGVDDESIMRAMQAVMETQGGLAVVDGKDTLAMPLPVAGIISDQKAEVVAEQYHRIHNRIKEMGSNLTAPLMTLSFMALIVIPDLKICDKGLYDVQKQAFTSVCV
jgi:adenine deaminase